MTPPNLPAASPGLVVLFTDNHLLVVDKPAGLLTQPAQPGDDSLLDRARAWIKARCGKPGHVYVGLVHRLDRNVSGVIVLARTSKAASRLADAFRTRRVDKTYLAVVAGDPGPAAILEHTLLDRDGGAIVDPAGRPARLSFSRVATAGGASLLRVTLLTGRKHQIRAQLAAAGHPLVGDPRYGQRSRRIARPALHAAELAFPHPVGGATMRFSAPAPEDFTGLLAALGLPAGAPTPPGASAAGGDCGEKSVC